MSSETVDLEAILTELRQGNPQGYGYLARYWGDAKRGLDNTDRNYARVAHIYGVGVVVYVLPENLLH